MPEDLNNIPHRKDTRFSNQKPVQEEFVPLGVERVVEGRPRGWASWFKEHAVVTAVGGFMAGYFLGTSMNRRNSMEGV